MVLANGVINSRKMKSIDEIMVKVELELNRARKAHSSMNSAHEGWAVIKEEMDELWEEVRQKEQSSTRMKLEAIQVAAMAVRFVLDVCERD